jgi:hypothetical protein
MSTREIDVTQSFLFEVPASTRTAKIRLSSRVFLGRRARYEPRTLAELFAAEHAFSQELPNTTRRAFDNVGGFND